MGELVIYGFLWALGWVGAVAIYVGEAFDYYVSGPITGAIDFLFGEFNGILSLFEHISSFAGPFSIDVASFLMGILILFIIMGSYYVFKGVTSLIGGI